MATLNGTVNADTLNGTATADTINGNAGNDTLNGAEGADTIQGGADNDTINGGDAGLYTMTGGDATTCSTWTCGRRDRRCTLVAVATACS